MSRLYLNTLPQLGATLASGSFICLLWVFSSSCSSSMNIKKNNSSPLPKIKFKRSYNQLQDNENQAGSIRERYIVWKDDRNAILNLKIVFTESAEQAERLLKDKEAQLYSVYEEHIDPYFAVVTKKTQCPEQYQIKKTKREGSNASVYSMFANDWDTLGACNQEMAKKHALRSFLICGSNFIQMDKFVPIQYWNDSDIIENESLTCPE